MSTKEQIKKTLETAEEPKPCGVRVGISACLLGHKVRMSGGHKRDTYLVETLGRYVQLIPTCLEAWDLNLGAPRRSLRLRKTDDRLRLITAASGEDHTDRAVKLAWKRASWFAEQGIDGFVFKAGSPSCGMNGVSVWNALGKSERIGRGVLVDTILDTLPYIPCEEESRLRDPRVRFHFAERIFAHRRLEQLLTGEWSATDLSAFHEREKMLLLSHDEKLKKALDRIVEATGSATPEQLADEYRRGFTTALWTAATLSSHFLALQHMIQALRDKLDRTNRRDLTRAVEDFGQGVLPLHYPLTLIRHYARVYEIEKLLSQSYLEPEKEEILVKYGL